ncbi:IgGFc-binding protein-like [Haliotis asinina]|uniref:IgGFc-binding protein-like n=1 Tax=Haliotis asinina TaxID=109174 RepID=UPI0035326549
MLSFIDLPTRQGNPLLFISAERSATVNITIPLLQWNLTKTLEPGQSWKKTLPRELRYNAYFTATPSAVYIASTSPVSVYVYDGYRIKASGYMALPFHALSTSYIAVTHGRKNGENQAPVMLIIASMDQTNVNVYYKLPSGEGCGALQNGDTSNHVLDAYDVLGMTCSGDFTGTRIVSDKPIVVISGHQDDEVSVDRGMDTIQEMLIPEDYFSLSYVLIKHGSKGTINRIVSASNNTQIIFSNGSSFHLEAFDFLDIDTDHTGQQCISSNNPVLAVAFGKSANGKSVGDASMCVLTANNMFTTSVLVDYGLADILGVAEYMYVVTVVDRTDLGAGVVAPGVSREEIPGCQYDVLTRKVENWPLSYSDGTLQFGSYLYGTNEDMYNGFSFPLNMRFVVYCKVD